MSGSPIIVVPFEVKSIDDAGEYYVVEGLAAVYGNVDSYDDIVLPGAFAADIAKRGNERPILWQHSRWEPIGKGVFTDTESGLMVRCLLPKADSFVSGRVMPQVKAGSVTGLSIGYVTIKYNDDENRGVRKLIELELYETSLVTFPANDQARILAAKNFLLEQEGKAVPPFRKMPIAEASTAWDGTKAVSQAREATGSEDEPSASYKTHFFYYDADAQDSFGAYKLPKALKIDGEFKYVPRGLAAVVGAIAGARGGVDIPDADKEKIKGQLNRLYRMMGREEPFKAKGMTLLDVETVRWVEPLDLERCLKDDGVILSSKACEHIAGVVAGKGEPGNGQGNGDGAFMAQLRQMKQEIEEL